MKCCNGSRAERADGAQGSVSVIELDIGFHGSWCNSGVRQTSWRIQSWALWAVKVCLAESPDDGSCVVTVVWWLLRVLVVS